MKLKLPLFVALALLIQQPLLAQPADLPVPAAKTGEYPGGTHTLDAQHEVDFGEPLHLVKSPYSASLMSPSP